MRTAGLSMVPFTVDGAYAKATVTVTFEPGGPALDDATVEGDEDRIAGDGVLTTAVTLKLVDEFGIGLAGRHDVGVSRAPVQHGSSVT